MKKVTAAIIEKEGKVLIAKRKKGDKLENKWEFPGGKIECNETPEECLKRELKEELGIECEIKDYVCSSKFSYEHISIELMAYRVSYISGIFVLKAHDEIKWITLSDYKCFDFSEADKPIIEELLTK